MTGRQRAQLSELAAFGSEERELIAAQRRAAELERELQELKATIAVLEAPAKSARPSGPQ